MARKSTNYTDDFKKQIVALKQNGKSTADISKEYDIAKSTINKWVKDYSNSGSFKAKDNRTDEENELLRLRKENKQLLMENDIFKAGSADNDTKIEIILSNKEKYSISAMCRVLNIPRSLVYYKRKIRVCNTKLENAIISIFRESKNNYGTRKIKIELAKQGMIASRRKIREIMNKYRLVSNYTVKQYKVHKSKCNEEKIDNIVHREFNDREDLEIVVSDLTYVNVSGKWHYICLLINLFNREIVGYSAGPNKDAKLVYEAFMNSTINLKKVKIFHTDRGNEFKNKIIDEILETFEIQRSLSKKGCPYDNAVAEAGYKIIKTEFAFNRIFNSLEELKLELRSYVLWYNNKRIHSSLNYMTPVEYRLANMTE
ncbi:IS3 family transposase [Clostridium sp. SM-530-WT-3G]|nr:IS3 family transposase [Clostridium sp. SM-530-WT-3G]NME83419.1 IS3 family transposase [Clostridium sp. SM-530-WT-3G]